MFNIFKKEVKENQVHSPIPLSWPSLPFFRTISTGMCCSSFLAPRHQAVSFIQRPSHGSFLEQGLEPGKSHTLFINCSSSSPAPPKHSQAADSQRMHTEGDDSVPGILGSQGHKIHQSTVQSVSHCGPNHLKIPSRASRALLLQASRGGALLPVLLSQFWWSSGEIIGHTTQICLAIACMEC